MPDSPAARPSALVVLSGGLDSAVALWESRIRFDDVEAVTFDYGQRHNVETAYAVELARRANVLLYSANAADLGALLSGVSSLTTPDVALETGEYADGNLSNTYVPNRNAIMLNIVAGMALAKGKQVVVTGLHGGEHPQYPDTRPQFVEALNAMLAVATQGQGEVRVEAPFISWDKGDIVAYGVRLGVPLSLTYSCYAGTLDHCGECATCIERRAAFVAAGVPDPTEYSA